MHLHQYAKADGGDLIIKQSSSLAIRGEKKKDTSNTALLTRRASVPTKKNKVLSTLQDVESNAQECTNLISESGRNSVIYNTPPFVKRASEPVDTERTFTHSHEINSGKVNDDRLLLVELAEITTADEFSVGHTTDVQEINSSKGTQNIPPIIDENGENGILEGPSNERTASLIVCNEQERTERKRTESVVTDSTGAVNSFFSGNPFLSIARKLDEVFPALSNKLSSIPSKLQYHISKTHISKSTRLRDSSNSTTTIKTSDASSFKSPTPDTATHKSCSPTLNSHDSTIPETESNYIRTNFTFNERLGFDFCEAPVLVIDKKYANKTILSRNVAKQLRFYTPMLARTNNYWKIIYGSRNDGFSLSTLHSLCSDIKYQFLVIAAVPYAPTSPPFSIVENSPQQTIIFGAYVNEGINVYNDFYGSNSCFLWRIINSPTIEPSTDLQNDASVDTSFKTAQHKPFSTVAVTEYVTARDFSVGSANFSSDYDVYDDESTVSSYASSVNTPRVEVYRSTGVDARYVLSDGSFVALGIGHIGKFGLWLNKRLDSGYTAPSATYGNPSLIDGSSKGSHFRICAIEVWSLSK